MSNIFNSNLLKELLSEDNNANLALPAYVRIVDKNTTNNFNSNYLPQSGGSWNKKTNTNEEDVNQLISMLTSESDNNSTDTNALENKLKNMVPTMDGGNGYLNAKKRKSKSSKKRLSNEQLGGADAEKIKEACKLLENAGYTFSIKNQTCEKYLEENSPLDFNNIFEKPKSNTTQNISNATSSFIPSGTVANDSATSIVNDKTKSDTSLFSPNFFDTRKNSAPTGLESATSASPSFFPTIKPDAPTVAVASETSTYIPSAQANEESVTSENNLLNTTKEIVKTIGNTVYGGISSAAKTASKIFEDSPTSTAGNTVVEISVAPINVPTPIAQTVETKQSGEKNLLDSKLTQIGSGAKKRGGKKSGSKKAPKKSSKKGSKKTRK